MASLSSYSSPSVRVEKATSEFLIGPDWTLNIDICDNVNSNPMLAKDVMKAVKKRLQHKNPKVQLLALTLLETMVKNCGDYVHVQILERNILHEMVKIVKKKTDMHVRDRILMLIGSWHEAFGGARGKYPQYYIAYEDLRRSGVQFPEHIPDAAPIFTPPVTHPAPSQPQPGYGMPSSSSTRLDEAMAAEGNLSLSSLDSMRDVLDLLSDMLQAIDPNDRSAIKDEVIIDLVEQCRTNQQKLMQLLETTGDEELLCKGLELNDNLQIVLAKHDAIASGAPLPPEVRNITTGASEKRDSSFKSAEVSVQNAPPSSDRLSAPVVPAQKDPIDEEEEEEEEDDFAQLARRHSRTRTDVPSNASTVKSDAAPPEVSMSNALVPINEPAPAPVRSKDQDLIDLLSITLSTTPSSTDHSPTQGHIPSTNPGVTFPSQPNHGLSFNSYVAPWAQPQPQPQHLAPNQPQNLSFSQPQLQAQPQIQPQYQYATQALNAPNLQPQYPQSVYPPPPWAATPGYFSNQGPASRPAYTYSTPVSNPARPFQYESSNGEILSPRSAAANVGPRPFVPSYRLFEDLNVFGNADGRFKATSNASPSLSGASNHNMVGGRK